MFDLTPPDPAAVARERPRVVRCFRRYTHEQRMDRAASHRLGPRQRAAVGEYFYTHPDIPRRSFPSRTLAATAAARAAQQPTPTPKG